MNNKQFIWLLMSIIGLCLGLATCLLILENNSELAIYIGLILLPPFLFAGMYIADWGASRKQTEVKVEIPEDGIVKGFLETLRRTKRKRLRSP